MSSTWTIVATHACTNSPTTDVLAALALLSQITRNTLQLGNECEMSSFLSHFQKYFIYFKKSCKSGVVNIYNLNESIKNASMHHPKPLKSFMNLTTPCTSLKFNGTSELLAACSAHAENACKLVKYFHYSFLTFLNILHLNWEFYT